MLSEKEVYQYFTGVKRQGGKGNSWKVICPCHSDKAPSLSITNDERTSKTLLKCHAGCNWRDIVNAAHIPIEKICGEQVKPQPEPAWKKNLIAKHDYYDNDNKYIYSKLKYPDGKGGKKCQYARVSGNDIVYGKGDAAATLYNLKALKNIGNRPLYYAEGEKDCDSLSKLGYVCVTAGGVGDWRSEYARYFKGKTVTILADNDEAGQELANTVERDISSYAYAVRIITPSNQPKGDITDYLDIQRDKRSAFESLIDEKNYPYHYAWYCDDKGKINYDALASTYISHNNIIVAKYQGKNADIPHIYCGGVYKPISKGDIMNELRQYIPYGKASASGLKGAAELVLASVSRSELDDFNKNENVINLKNGLYDIRRRRLEPHSPKLLSTIQLNLDYDEEATCPKWLTFIDEFCSDTDGNVDEEMKSYLQEITGFILSNIYGYRLKNCLVLYSGEGNTGKSVYLNILIKLLGELNVANVSFQRMSTDRFATADLYGKRLNAVPDQASTDLKESSTFKQLTGGDPNISAQYKGLQSFIFEFRGYTAIACNLLPAFQDDKGEHLIDRLGILHCRNVIAADKRNKNLVQELASEASGIFNWSMIGLQRLRGNNLKLTKCSSADTIKQEYRLRIDNLYSFITECCCTGDGLRVHKRDFEDAYLQYCDDNGYQHINRKSISQRLESYHYTIKKYNGYDCYQGIELLPREVQEF